MKTFILEKQLSTIELFATDDLLVLKYLIELQLYDFFQTLLMKAWPHGHILWELSTDICVINEQLKDKNLISYMSVCNEMFINDAINIQCIPSHTEPSVAALGYHPSV